ncbi:MAG TPA: P1 family peptidase [Actinomycetota bacterium]|nr:P1 family peptidase [Actinomycetota bacterium]
MDEALLATPAGKPRARSLGIPFDGVPGANNAITDVPGCEVGFTTLVDGDAVRTGVTAIVPRGRGGVGDPCVAGFHSLNGNGEMTGVSWIAESGTTTGPIAITNTHAIGPAHEGIVRWTSRNRVDLAESWLLPVVAETWDGYLNDINGAHVDAEDAVRAIDAARGGRVEEGSVGGGTGMCSYAYKGGSGTASRVVELDEKAFTVGVFVQANFGSRHELTIAGVRVGRALADDDPMKEHFARPAGAGSVIAIVVTDAPLLPQQCQALARRVTLGLARTGTTGSHFSGDLFLAVSTANAGAFDTGADSLFGRDPVVTGRLAFVQWAWINPLYDAVVHATEEAVIDALVANDEMIGIGGHRVPALPRDRVVDLLRSRGALDGRTP